MKIGDKVEVIVDSSLEEVSLGSSDFGECTEGKIIRVDDALNMGYVDVDSPFVYLVQMEDGVEWHLAPYMLKKVEEEPPEYSGEGLPPVGTVCKILGTASGSWSKGVIDYIDSKHCIWHWLDGSQETMHNRVYNMKFRPIKSEKQKEIDKIVSELLKSVNKNGDDFVYQEWEIAEHLYNAGLRFTKDSK